MTGKPGLLLDENQCIVTGKSESLAKAQHIIVILSNKQFSFLQSVLEITGSAPTATSLVLDGDTHVHVAYHVQGEEDVLLLAMPNSCASSRETELLLGQLSRLVRFRFGSAKAAFGQKEGEGNSRDLNEMFSVFAVDHVLKVSQENVRPKHVLQSFIIFKVLKYNKFH